MNFKNLKENKCPKCHKTLIGSSKTIPNVDQPFNPTIKHSCGFQIHEIKMRQIITNEVTASLETKLEQEYQDDLL